MIRLDCTKDSVVIVCDSCGVWHAFAFSKGEGWERAAAHEERAHPGEHQARNALSTFRKRERHAV